MLLEIEGLEIVPVNGYWIRQTLDTDFAIIHRHAYLGNKDYSRKDYVPEKRAWIDYRQLNELDYLLWAEKKYFADVVGDAYNQRRLEIIESLKNNWYRIPEFVVSQKTTPDGLLVVHIDGSQIRRNIDPEFVQGGHGYVYSYIPKRPRQVWVDATMDPRDWPPVESHEIKERHSMSRGQKYESAHEIATRLEKSFRIAHGGSYASSETPLGYTPEQLHLLYLDLTK